MRNPARRLKRLAGKVGRRSRPRFNVDSPRQRLVDTDRITLDGWLLPPKTSRYVKLRAKNGEQTIEVAYGLTRNDVARTFPEIEKKVAAHSGFSADFEYVDGTVILEADFGKGFTELWRHEIASTKTALPRDRFNPQLGERMADHLDLIAGKAVYFKEPAHDSDFKRDPGDPRLVAFYLPQFHPIEENDRAWGKGFTEWTNVTSDVPRFVGHLQPILPADLGFYDLRLDSVMEAQIRLAKKYGVFGFCFYYYWFSGKQLLETPLNSFLKQKDWDFNFTICWANENWTKRWDGRDSEVIVAQKYRKEDPLEFIRSVEHILLDPRYIREGGKPALLVYRASELKDPEAYTKAWRTYFKKKHGLDLYLISIQSFDDRDPREYGFDTGLDFAPQSSFFKGASFEKQKFPYLDVSGRLLDSDFGGTVADYRELALNPRQFEVFPFPTIKSVTPSWDNDSRKKNRGFVLDKSNPDLYATWLDSAIASERPRAESPLVFVNAWNEWAEGAMLEPSAQYGHATLVRTAEVLAKHSKHADNRKNFPQFGISRSPSAEVAVVLHLFYPELWEKIAKRLSALENVPYDLYVTLSERDRDFAVEIHRFKKRAHVIVVPNRGRDVLPFLHIARRLDQHGYRHLLKLHSKKSTHRSDGQDWLQSILAQLLPGEAGVAEIMESLRGGTGLVGPEGHFISLDRYLGSNEPAVRHLMEKLGHGSAKIQDLSYFGGTMFWANFEALRPLLNLHLMIDDFDAEGGQIDGTFAHAIERVIAPLVYLNGHSVAQNGPGGMRQLKMSEGSRRYPFAP